MAGHGRTIRLRDVNHAWRHVHGDNARAEIGQTTRELSVTAGDVENGFAALNCEQPLLRRRDKLQMEVVAVAHAAFHESALASQTRGRHRSIQESRHRSRSLRYQKHRRSPTSVRPGPVLTRSRNASNKAYPSPSTRKAIGPNAADRAGLARARLEGARGDQCHGADERKAVVHRKDAPTSATVRIGKDQEDYHNSGLLRIFVRRRAR